MSSRSDPCTFSAVLASWGRWGSIVSLLEPLFPVYRNDPVFMFYLGVSWLKLGAPDFAVVYLQRAMQLKPRDLRISLTLASAFLMRGQQDKAIGMYINILDVFPQELHALKAMKWIKKTVNDSAMYKHEPVIPFLKTVSGFFPDGGLPKSFRICIWAVVLSSIVITIALLLKLYPVLSRIYGN